MSETATCRDELAPYCIGLGMDVGYGGDKIVPHAWAFDMPAPYTRVGFDRQQLRGDCRTFPFLCDNALDFIFSAHLLEDFYYHELTIILSEFRRVLKPGGLMITNCPDQQRFLAHCAATGQGINMAHREPDFSLATFRLVIRECGGWEEVYSKPEHGAYSFLLVVRKV